MPAIGKITLDSRDYEKTLERIRTLTEKQSQKTAAAAATAAATAAKATQEAAGKVGSNISSVGGALSAFGAAAGQHLGAVGQAISALSAGPIAMLITAIGTMSAVGVLIWDKLTLSAEEYAEKLSRVADRAEKDKQKLINTQIEDRGYMDRLVELSKQENLSNAAKAEAANLIRVLTERYGNLGVAIDGTTGKIIAADKAQQKLLESQRKQRLTAVGRQMSSLDKKINKQAEFAVEDMFIGSGWNQAEVSKKAVMDVMYNSPLEKRLELAEKMRDMSKTKTDIDNWQAVIDSLEKQIELLEEYDRLMKTRYSSEKEQADALRKNTEAAAKSKKTVPEKTPEERFNAYRQKETQSLYIQALKAMGKTAEAAEKEALSKAETAKGSALTDEEKAMTLKFLELSSELQKLSEKPEIQGDFAIRTNELTARGGFQTGVRIPDTTMYQKQIANNTGNHYSAVQRIETMLKEMIGQ